MISSMSLSSTPPKHVQCAACTNLDGFPYDSSRTFKLMDFYKNDAFDKLNISVAITRNRIYCDRCVFKNPISLQLYYQHANLVGVRIYEEIVHNLKGLFPHRLEREKALANVKNSINGMKVLMDITKSFRAQTFRVYRHLYNKRNRVDTEFSRNAMNEFVKLLSCSEKIVNTYEFIIKMIERNTCQIDLLQLMVYRQVLNFSDSMMNGTENNFNEFEHFIDVFSRAARGGLEMLERNPELFVFRGPKATSTPESSK